MSKLLSVTLPSTRGSGTIFMNGRPNSTGIIYSIEDVEGFWTPEVELDTSERVDDGAVVNSARYGGLTFTVVGMAHVLPGSSFDVPGSPHYLRRELAAILPYGEGEITVSELHQPYGLAQQPQVFREGTVTARRSGAARFGRPGYNSQPFELEFFTPDPRKRIDTRSVPDTSQVVHPVAINVGGNGLTPTPLKATLLTPVSSAYIQHEGLGRRVSFGSSYVPAGTIVDFEKRQTIHPTDGVKEMLTRPRGWFELQMEMNYLTFGGRWKLEWWRRML